MSAHRWSTRRPVAATSVLTAVPLLAIAAGAACSSAGPRPVPAPAATSRAPTDASAALQCPDFIGTDSPPADYVVIGDAVALPGPTRGALQTSNTGDSGGTRLFAKAGLLIRSGRPARLSVPAPARIGWGTPGTPAQVLTVPACPAASGGAGWLAYAGGFYVETPRCLAVTVQHDGRSTVVEIGIGTACPGQQPPPSPSES